MRKRQSNPRSRVSAGPAPVGDRYSGTTDDERKFTMRLRMILLPILAVLLGMAAVAPSAMAAAPSEVKLEVNENCVLPDWPCWATPGSSEPAAKVAIAAGGSIAFTDDITPVNIAWT